MNKTEKIFSIILFFVFSFSFSQEILIKGKVTDNQNRGIESASVLILDNNDETIAYSFSDEKGYYNLNFDKKGISGVITLKVSSLDHVPKEIKINPESALLKDIVLEDKIETIKEVILEGKKVKINQDTTSIRVASFGNKTEQTVEDILKKLPGIEVLNDGSIKAHGKKIEKLLVEGEDLLDKNYKLLSKNLDSKTLDEVQIIDNFEDNPILKKLNNSDKVAINLKLKKGLKNVWFGNVTLGSGVLSENRWKESLNLGLLKKKIKLFYFGDYNNLGEKATDLITTNVLENNQFGNDRFEYKTKSLYSIANNEPQFFAKTQSSFNNAFLNSLSFTSKLKENLSLRGVIYLTYDKQKQNSFSETVLNIENNNPISYTENNFYNNRKTLASAELELKYYPNDKNYITNLFIFKDNPNKTSDDLIFNSENINQSSKSKNSTFYNHFNHTYELSSNKVLNNYFYFGSDRVNEKTTIFSPLLNSFLNLNSDSKLLQTAGNNILYSGIKSKLITKLKRLDVTNSLQAEYNSELFNNKLLSDNEFLSTDYNNHVKLNQFKVISDNSIRFNFSKTFDITGNISLQNINYNYNDIHKNIFLINPSIYLNIKKTKLGSFTLSYSENSTLPEINQLTDDYQLTDYRSFSRGTNYQTPLKNTIASFAYYIYIDDKRFSINTNMFYLKSKSILNTENIITNDFSFNSLQQTFGGESYNFNFSFTNYIRKLNISSRIETNNIWNSNPVNVNSNNFSTSKGYTNKIKYSATTYFKIPVNFDFGFSYNYNQTTFNDIKNTNITKDLFLNVNYKISKTLLAESNNSLYFIFSQKYSFNNLVLSYNPIDSKFSYRIIFNNILNEKEYVYTALNNYTNFTSRIQLVPRYLLASVKYRF
ncbi:carboxypeptidase regulatory-like domain-containing protein [Chryseobacterium sp. RP-3-3]|uniref:Carboxypeptidase regulatory-like domain-containing protein n=1 Tax=Chryseobacterium antibioticum TaxID=2728847 RepID=A0A7Y0AP39_9FLAO|nr:carboxypeptidase-like regulatory domain-containing protein [Chryseobacterium antibioticum]NML70757.1 carboxypeptidase regulatory-like domain-containing protein [Chryseobacterium antibioticum]